MSSSFLKDLFIYDRGREMPARGIIKRIRRYFCRAKAQRYKYPYKSVHHIITPPSALVKLFFRFLRNSRICAPKAPRRAFFGRCAATGILHIYISDARSAAAHRSKGAGAGMHKSGVLPQKGNYPLTRRGRYGILDTVQIQTCSDRRG